MSKSRFQNPVSSRGGRAPWPGQGGATTAYPDGRYAEERQRRHDPAIGLRSRNKGFEAGSKYRELLADPDAGVRIAAAHVLLRHGDLEGKPTLLGALRSPDVHHRIDAALALQRLSDPESIAELRRASEAERHPLARIIFKEVLKGKRR